MSVQPATTFPAIRYASGANQRLQVDFIIGDHTAVEVKAKENVSGQDVKSLRALREEAKLKKYICVCLEQRRREADGIDIVPYAEFLSNLWAGTFQ